MLSLPLSNAPSWGFLEVLYHHLSKRGYHKIDDAHWRTSTKTRSVFWRFQPQCLFAMCRHVYRDLKACFSLYCLHGPALDYTTVKTLCHNVMVIFHSNCIASAIFAVYIHNIATSIQHLKN